MNGFFLVALGGAIGAAGRYGAGRAAMRLLPGAWPWGTFFVNVTGSFAMGLVAGWLALKGADSHQNAKLFLATGVLGGFTTFSAFSLEVVEMLRADAMARAAAYAGASIGLGVAALILGLWLARRFYA